MTLLNTIANLGSSLPGPAIMYMMGQLTVESECSIGESGSGGECVKVTEMLISLSPFFSAFLVVPGFILWDRRSNFWENFLRNLGEQILGRVIRSRRRFLIGRTGRQREHN